MLNESNRFAELVKDLRDQYRIFLHVVLSDNFDKKHV